ncbi:urate hydroxylase PuuD [Bdellovibrio sp. HCB2-146]|uniref:urate hydroxylase PuuD n=1 Tax=Bdellovibrio sp. HCB2-146 TaxID=3394362 RepID=UPI0039BD0F1D
MNQEIYEWILLLARWLHITVGITWIGTSIFFMWLDRTFEFNQNSKNPGHVGDLWMVHGGGFYHVEKMQMGPTKVPEQLHWFKWESYWTWMSGVFLLIAIFYTGSGTFLLDSSVSGTTYWEAVAIGVGSIVVSWLFYDFLWETKLTKDKPIVGHVLTLSWLAGMAYFLCHTLSGRAAYIHIGAMLGTWMTANVFLRIIPRQVKMVEASKKGEAVNQDWGKNAKNRSTHNTYFTLPVIFIMMSNHFSSTYGNKWNWIILLVICAAGAAIREFFVVRLKNPKRSKTFGALGVAMILALVIFTRENTGDTNVAEATHTEAPKAASATVPADPNAKTEVKGIVKFVGAVPQGEQLLLPFACATHYKGNAYSNEVIVNDGRLKNVLIRVVKGLEGRTYTDIPSEPVVMDQIGCLYEPRIATTRVGQKVEFLNSDALFHNVRTIANNNATFNEAMPNKNDKITKVFNKPEVFVQAKCSVHPWMSGYIAVMDNPFFSLTNDKGEFAIKDLPPGTYTLELWHEIFGTQTKEITIAADSKIDLEFEFTKK